MNINATTAGITILVLAIIFIPLTIKFAKGKTDNLMLVGFYATVLNFIIAPLGWIYCGFWFLKKAPVSQ